METGIIYKATNKTNGKSYIGFTVYGLNQRKLGHYSKVRQGSKSYFHNALRKCGKENFEWEILKEQATLEDEKALIQEHKTYGGGYNQTIGGEGTIGSIRSLKTRKKLSEASSKPRSEFFKQRMKEVANSPEGRAQRSRQSLGRKLSNEHKEKNRIAQTGRVLSEETRRKIGIKSAQKRNSEETREKLRIAMLGKKHTEETLAKQRATLATPEAKEKMRLARQKWKPEQTQRMAKSLQKRIIINGVMYESHAEAAKANNVSVPTLSYWKKTGKAHTP